MSPHFWHNICFLSQANQNPNNMQKTLFVLLVFLLFFSGTNSFTIEGYEPIYISKEDAKKIELLSPRDVTNQGKIYIKDQYIYVGDINLGVHIIDNTDPTQPKKIAFLQIYGNHDIAIKGNILYADNLEDLVSIDISDRQNPQLKKRIEGVYKLLSQNYPENMPYYTYFECVDPEKGYVVGWKPTMLENPDCWTSY